MSFLLTIRIYHLMTIPLSPLVPLIILPFFGVVPRLSLVIQLVFQDNVVGNMTGQIVSLIEIIFKNNKILNVAQFAEHINFFFVYNHLKYEILFLAV